MFRASELPERLNAGRYVLPVTVESDSGLRYGPVHGCAVGGPDSPCGDGTVLLLDDVLKIVGELPPSTFVRFVDAVDVDSASFLFFVTHAGSSYRPNVETEEEGRRRGAAALVRAERWARANGITFEWDEDWDVDHQTYYDCYTDGGPETCEVCTAFDADGAVLDAMGCIDDATPEYRRVVEAELALAVMPND